ncbi:MAG: copper chaperone PCu(A)C [Gammaproteobacteria bacterium]|nr:copper chaperone PCu(A)C [Gammaproteobacteria bacterium]
MSFKTGLVGFLLFGVISLNAVAEVRLLEGWTRSPPPGVDRLAIYGRLVNDGDTPVVLSRLELAGAGQVMLHETVMDAGQMRMRHIDPIELSPSKALVMTPQGLHLMVMGLARSPQAGETLTIKATTRLDEVHTFLVRVQPITALGPVPN